MHTCLCTSHVWLATLAPSSTYLRRLVTKGGATPPLKVCALLATNEVLRPTHKGLSRASTLTDLLAWRIPPVRLEWFGAKIRFSSIPSSGYDTSYAATFVSIELAKTFPMGSSRSKCAIAIVESSPDLSPMGVDQSIAVHVRWPGNSASCSSSCCEGSRSMKTAFDRQTRQGNQNEESLRLLTLNLMRFGLSEARVNSVLDDAAVSKCTPQTRWHARPLTLLIASS